MKTKNSFYETKKLKIPFFGVLMNLFQVVMTIIRCCVKENFYPGVFILLLAKIGFEKKFNQNNFQIKVLMHF